jgi:hypothetical protein
MRYFWSFIDVDEGRRLSQNLRNLLNCGLRPCLKNYYNAPCYMCGVGVKYPFAFFLVIRTLRINLRPA